MRWRTGVVLDKQEGSLRTTAVIRADQNAKRIYIYIDGVHKRDHFAIIRKVFHDIHNSFEELKVKELMPLPDLPDVRIDYYELLGYEFAGREEYFVGRLRRAYSVQTLLNGLIEKSKRIEEGRQQALINVRGNYIAGNYYSGENKMRHQPKQWEKVIASITGLSM